MLLDREGVETFEQSWRELVDTIEPAQEGIDVRPRVLIGAGLRTPA